MPTDPTKTTIAEVANMLEVRRKTNKRTTLVLGARAGGFFRSKELLDILRRFSSHDFTHLTPLEQFAECYQVLNRRGQFSESDLDGILRQALNEVFISEADLCLAELIKENFFDTIISTNIDDLLERALERVDLKYHKDFDIIIPGHKATIYIDYTEKPFPYRIIKVFGDLSSRVYNIVERRKQITTTRLGETEMLRALLERTLARDILVVGLDPIWDEELLVAFPPRSHATSYWYVNEQEPDHLLQRTWQGGAVRLITGEDGNYGHFIKALHWHLRKEQPGNDKKQFTSSIASSDPFVVATASTTQPGSLSGGPARKAEQDKQPASLSLASAEKLAADVLIITATEVEAEAVLSLIPDNKLCFIRDKTYYELGTVGGARTFMVQSEMGYGGPGGSLLTVAEGIRALAPSAIIMVGIAFGCDPTKQRIGDILVSQQIVQYDLQRVGTAADGTQTVLVRGDRSTASIRLLDRFRSGRRGWPRSPRVRFGLILSGAKLVDNLDYREQLRAFEPEAIGGEMEGAGLYAAAQRFKIDWLLVKAICDWADGNKHQNKSKRQKQAADNAARFTLHVIRQGGLK
ncbi:MAG TPA: SIR2 family protein [Ktedonosporobacter sp.]|jgi:nucleoside phosphorylase|nr:SIR2 family protein [Ktedonosporobacter sp.]